MGGARALPGAPDRATDEKTIAHNEARPRPAAPGSVTSAGLPFAILEPLDAAGVTGRLLADGRLSLRPASAVTPEVRAHVASNGRAVADAVEARTRIAELMIDVTQRTARVVNRFWPQHGGDRLLSDLRLKSIERRINAAGARLDFDGVERGCDEYIAWARALATDGAGS